jgi:coenzyme F420-dependent glucose-6-phosphate dehydrogenase
MNVKLGYSLSSEEHAPKDLIRYAKMAEDTGFSFALISDHYHPWTKRQGHSPFVWNTLGAISQVTSRLVLGTGVTCPTMRIHPIIIAQAAATAAVMMPGRFFLGLGTGENLNEHILGKQWPSIEIRREMLEEAVKILRLLWRGGSQSYYGKHYTVEHAQVFDLPAEPPPIMIAAAGPTAAELAGSIGDGLISTVPEATIVKKFHASDSGVGKPCFGQMTVCWAETEQQAKKIAREWWPVAAVPGALMSELATPAQFEAAAKLVTEDAVASTVICGADPEKYLREIRSFSEAGFDHVYIHQVGPDQEGFFRFYRREIFPRLEEARREERPLH